MAMCFSLAAFNPAGALPVRIHDPQCVAKTFPDYFETLFAVTRTDAPHIPVICVDGPTASGKGTLAAEVAHRLGYHYLDSGALYRITAPGRRARRAVAGRRPRATHRQDGRRRCRCGSQAGRVLLDGEDVTDAIRTEEAGMNASQGVGPARRCAPRCVALQQSFRRLPGLVADGRDMGTVIFPDAAAEGLPHRQRRPARRAPV